MSVKISWKIISSPTLNHLISSIRSLAYDLIGLDYKIKKDEIFRRIKANMFAQLVGSSVIGIMFAFVFVAMIAFTLGMKSFTLSLARRLG